MATTTVATLVADSRFDLNDHGKQKYDDSFLIRMLNRGIRVLDRELITIGSQLNIKYASDTLLDSTNYLALDTTVDNIIRLYIDQVELAKKSLTWLYRYRIEEIGTDTGQPYYFGIWGKPSTSGGRLIEFDYTADQDYTINYIYNHLTPTLTSTDYMPYDDMFNDYLREGIVVIAQKAQENKIVQVDQIWRELFRYRIHQSNLASSFTPRYYYKDF